MAPPSASTAEKTIRAGRASSAAPSELRRATGSPGSGLLSAARALFGNVRAAVAKRTYERSQMTFGQAATG